eukprot:g28151.t1
MCGTQRAFFNLLAARGGAARMAKRGGAAGGKVTDGPTGEAMLEACRQALPEMEVRKALDSEFGQAVAVASLVRPQG